MVTQNCDGNAMLYVMICGTSHEREVMVEAKKTKGKWKERSAKRNTIKII